MILETDGEGNLKARYTRGINYISHLDNANTERFYLYNGHGDVAQTVDIQGNVQNNYEYDIFGNLVLTIEIYSNSIRYAGEFLDIETGLYYLRARYYNPYTGRFTSEDSYWGETDNPLSLNLYTYCANDPIMFIDPSGHVVSEWDREHLTDEEIRRLEELTNKYIVANAAGNTYDMEAAHSEAEAIRDKYREGDTGFIGSASGYTYVMGEDNQAKIYSSDENATEHAYNRYGYKPKKEKSIVEIIQEDTAMSKPEAYNPISGDIIMRSGEILEYDISGNTGTKSTTPNIPDVVTPDKEVKNINIIVTQDEEYRVIINEPVQEQYFISGEIDPITQAAIEEAQKLLDDVLEKYFYIWPEGYVKIGDYTWSAEYRRRLQNEIDNLKEVASFFNTLGLVYNILDSKDQAEKTTEGNSKLTLFTIIVQTIMKQMWDKEPGISDLPEALGIKSWLTKRIEKASEKSQFIENSNYKYLVYSGRFLWDKGLREKFIDRITELESEIEEQTVLRYSNEQDNIKYKQAMLNYLGAIKNMNINYEQSVKEMNFFLDMIDKKYR